MRRLLPPSTARSLSRVGGRARNLERRFIQPGAGTRIVYGMVYNDGDTQDAGSGDWSVVQSGINKFTFTLDTVFAHIPTVLATPTNDNPAGTGASNPSAYFAVAFFDDITTSTFTVYTFDLIGDPDAGSFAFAAIGPSA